MGFLVGYSELLLSKLFFHLVFLLCHVCKLISWAFHSVGLGDLLLDSGISSPCPAYNHHRGFPEFQSVSAMLIQDMLPVVRFEELRSEGWDLPDACAVCLQEFEGADEIRRPSNCRHVFHRCCLDSWTEHDHKTCPLCRTPLFPLEMQDGFDDTFWAAAGIPDSSSSSSSFSSSYGEDFNFDQYSPNDDDGDDDSLSLLPQSPPHLASLQLTHLPVE